MFFNRSLASTVGVKDGTLTSRAVTPVHPHGFFGSKVVTCLAHSKEHFKTSFVSTGGGGDVR